MVVKKTFCALLIFFIFLVSVYAEQERALLIDDAGVLSAEAFTKIEKQLQTVSRKSDSEAVIVIVSDTERKTPQEYADGYFDYNDYGRGTEKEGSLLLIVTGDGSAGSRYAHISTHGEKTIGTLTDAAIEDLLDALIDGGLKDNRYEAGIRAYLKTLAGNFYNSLSVMEILIGLAAAVLMFLVKFFGTQKKYKKRETFSAEPLYIIENNAAVQFTPIADVFISSNTVSRIIPKADKTGGSGGSSTHTSSSGETHGGGGRSF